MKRIITSLILILGIGFQLQAQLQPMNSACEQNPCQARPICATAVSNPFSYQSNTGNPPGAGTCANSLGATFGYLQNWMYYEFTCYTAGTFNFNLVAVDPTSDYDWAIWNITAAGCGSVLSGGLPIECNSYPGGGAATGIAAVAALGFEPTLNLVAGNRYILGVSRRNGGTVTTGFNLTFSGTAVIVNPNPPALASIIPFDACSAVDTIKIKLSDKIRCSQIGASDFNVPGATISAAAGANCPGCAGVTGFNYSNVTDTVILTFNPPISPGAYTLSLNAAPFSNICGVGANTVPTLNFNVSANLDDSIRTGFNCATQTYVDTVYAKNGAPLYQFKAQGPGQTNTYSAPLPSYQVYAGLAGNNTYTFTVRDAALCVADSVLFHPAYQSISIQTFKKNPPCFNQFLLDTFKITSITGGKPPYSFSLTSTPAPAAASAVQYAPGQWNNLPQGTYTITVTDGWGCTQTATANIPNPAQLIMAAPTSTNPACFGDSTGTISVSTSGGTPFIQYSISPNPPTAVIPPLGTNPATITGLPGAPTPGLTYTIVATDANGCTATNTRSLTNPAAITINTAAVAFTNPTCLAPCGGSITAFASGGTGGKKFYKYPLVTPPNTYSDSVLANGGQFQNLCAGTYTILCKDVVGCTTTTTFNLVMPPIPDIVNNSITNVLCNGGCSGQILNTTTGGTTPYSYSISPSNNPPCGNAVLFGAGGDYQNLPAGTYKVVVTSPNNCKDSVENLIITEPTPVLFTSASFVEPLCNGGNTGTIASAASGGTGTITYTITPLGPQTNTTGNFANLTAQSYTITGTDVSGCSTTTVVSITQPTAVSFSSASFVEPSCNGGNNGTISSSASGGTGIITYTISPLGPQSNTSGNFSNLTAQPYTVTATDVNGCTSTTVVNVTQPSAVTFTSATFVEPLCNGNNNGTISSAASGGTGTITYTITPLGPQSNTTGNFSNLTAQSYTITGTDVNGCTSQTVVNVTQPATMSFTSATFVEPLCNGNNNGTISSAASGGTGTITYTITPLGPQSNTTGNFSGLSAQSYTITGTDVNGCTTETVVNVTQPTVVSFSSASFVAPLCNGNNNGTISSSASGGTGTITYTITPLGPQSNTTGNFSNLTAQSYTVTATDVNGCTSETVVNVTEPTLVSFSSASFVEPSCNGGNNGTISSSASGGTGIITYTISPLGPQSNTSGNFSNLTAQPYTVTATDVNGCTSTTVVNVTQPSAVTFTSATFVEPLCNGNNNGTISSAASGGTGTITYTITPLGPQSNTTGNFSNLTAQSYTITGTDVNGCTSQTVVNVTQPATMSFTSATFVEPLCNGNNNGTISSAASGGTGTITYTITPLGPQSNTTGNFSGLSAQSYTITGTDVNGCTTETVVNVTQPTVVSFSSASFVAPLCNGNNNGTISSSASGGTGTITYTITPLGPQSNTTGNFSNLTAQSYTITGTDVNGCTSETVVNVTEPTLVSFSSASFVEPSCNGGNNGTISSSASGGTGIITYTISPLGPQSNTSGNFSNLTAQPYTVTATDVNGCTSTTVVNVTQPSAVTFTSATFVEPLCNGNSNGTISSAASGGTGTITYTITPLGPQSNTTGNFSNLTAQSYTITGTDVNGCTSQTVVNVTQPATMSFTSATFVEPLCNGNNNGTISSAASGGTGTITYTITPLGPQSNTTGNFSGLSAQSYTITGTDVNGCTTETVVNVTQPTVVSFSSASFVAPLCNGNNNGTISSSASGGTGTITYTITPLGPQSNTTGNFSNLTAQSYTITGTDVNGCTSETVVNVTEPTLVSFSSASFVEPSCNGGNNGTISSSASGGTGIITYTISPLGPQSNTTGNFSNLTAQCYTITATDVNGCTSTTSTCITEPTAVVVTVTASTDPSCTPGCDGTASVGGSGGTGPITYGILPAGPTQPTAGNFSGLCAGTTYTITGTDGNGCTGTTTISLSTPNAPIINVTAQTAVTCFGDCDGTAQVTTIAGITYTISGPGTPSINATGAASNLCVGNYVITATDANSCVGTTSVTITGPALLTLAINTSTDPSCVPGCDGTATITTTGGNGSNVYTIAPSGTINASTGAASDLCAGTIYTITATDVNGCSSTTTIQLTTPASPVINITSSTDPSCVPGCDGTATVTAIVGGNYTIAPSGTIDPVTGAASALCAGITYTITVTDGNGCTGTTTVQLTTPGSPVINITSSTDPSCVPGCDGTATVTAIVGGNYTIAPSGTIDPLTGAATALCAGITYTITVTDGNGCTGTTTVQLTTPGSPVINITASTDPSCVPGCDGTATVTAIVGGTYSIAPSGTIDPVTGAASALCAGITYTITVTDGNGCTGTTTVQLTTPSSPVIALVSQTNASCNAVCDGLAQVTTLAGLNYSIAGPGTPTINATGAASNLCAGNYVITATDANGCTGTTSVTITEPTAVVVTVTSSTDPSCTPGCDGTASVGGSGGTGPITYGILPAGPTQPTAGNFSGLCAGTSYTITGTDGNGCTGTTTISLSTPNAPIINVTAQTAVTCFGDCDGTAQVTTIAGITYTISGPGTPSINATGAASNLCVGNYVITATDANSCVGTTSVTITGPALLTLAINTSTDPSCVPGCDGTATITTTGGNGSNVYTIAPSGTINASTGAASDLCAGTIYTITATDVNGCSSTTTIQLTTPASPVINITSSTDPSCVPGCDGTATVTAIVGGNYTIAPSGTIDPVTGAASALCAGITYTITVTDGNGCTGTTTVQLTTPGSPVINITSSTDPSCVPGCDGTATVTAIVGGNYTIAPSGTIDPLTGAATALCAGITYTITVTDGNGCTGTTTVQLTTPGSPVINITASTDPSCVPGCDGTATVTAIVGGTYSIAPSGTIDPVTGAASALCAGITYTITVTDGNGCTGTTTVQLTTPSSPVIALVSQTNASCNAVCDGLAQVTTLAGLNYSIAGPGTPTINATGAASNLCAGNYVITATDANGCTGTTSVTITEPTAVVVTVTSSTDPSCTPGCDGTASVGGSGGTGPITYGILPAGPTQPTAGNFSGLCAGTSYTITGTDGNGCTGTTTISLSTPNAPIINVTAQTAVTCFGDCDGTAQVTTIAGITYGISGPGAPLISSTGSATQLCVGNYVITATDANSCVGTTSVTITGPALLTLAINTSTDPSCVPGCDGTATITTTGGNGSNVYTIAPSGTINASTGAASDLCAGTIYTITATDVNGCTSTTTIQLTTPASPVINITSSADPSCVPGCDGTATVTAIAGGSYSIAPSGTINASTGAASALCAGITYTITVTDGNGCTGTTTVQLTTPGSPVINITASTNPSCVPGCDGTATVTAIAGGTYSIAPSGTINASTGAASALCSGITYTITVTDVNGCTGTTTVQLTTPGSPVINITASTNPSCVPGCDGTATVTAIVGGNYTIAPSGTIDPLTGAASALCSGITYTITVTDGNGCTGTTTVLLITPGSPVIAVTSSTNPSCVPGCDGTATVTAIAGGAYAIAPSGTIDPVTGATSALCAGITYTITVTDGNGCTGTTSILLNAPSSPTVSISSIVNPTTSASCDGTAQATGAGGSIPYSYSISAPGVIDPLTGAISALCDGCYTVTVSDGNGCTGTATFCVAATGLPLSVTAIGVDATCFGTCDGTAQANPSGGAGGYTYIIIGSGSPAINATGAATGLCAGAIYTITVSDANLATATTTIVISEPTQLTVSITSSTDPSCVPGCDGTVTVTSTGGSGSNTFNIAPSGTIDPLTGAASALCAGITYTITVTDVNGCVSTTSILLNTPGSPVINITASTDPSCVPGCDGTATVTAIAGGTYSIAPSGTIDPLTGAASALCSGITYTITVTDGNSCTGTTSILLTTPGSPVIAITSSTDPSCVPGCDGTATVTAIAGGTYSIAPSGTIDPLTGAASALCSGITYTITVTDGNSCTGTTSILLTTPGSPVINITSSTNPSCLPGCDGTATVTAIAGGTYSIAPSGTIDPVTGASSALCAGITYTITVTDGNGCTGTTSIQLTTPGSPVINITSSTNPSCVPGCDGTATVTAIAGGTYSIAPSGTIDPVTGAASSLCAGIVYTITVTDGNGCTGTTSIQLTTPGSPVINITSTTNPSCVPGCDGTATVTAIAGGTYSIAPSGTIDPVTGAASSLCAGIVYTITVTDGNGCTGTTSVQLNTPSSPIINIISSTNPSCVPGCDGTATVTAIAGGTYTIAPIGTINPATGAASALCGGTTYTITVTDANGCTGSTTIQLITPVSPVINVTSTTDPSCLPGCDGTATVTSILGGNYSIAPGGAINPATGAASALCAGTTYTITVTDGNGCTGTTTLLLNTPASPSIVITSQTNLTCNGVCNGTADVTLIAGGVYTIVPAATINAATGAATNLCAGTYTITVTQANGCTGTTSVTITEPTAVQITNLTASPTLCFGQANGSLSISVSGGTPLYTATTNPASSGAGPANSPLAITGLAPSTYTVTITDANGCTATSTATVQDAAQLVFTSATVVNPTCANACNGTVSVTANGGTGTITYTINPQGPQSNTTGNFNALCAGTYTVTATDVNGCTVTTTVTLTDPAALVVASSTFTDPLCFGNANGTITVTLGGGTVGAGYVYAINPAATQPTPGNFTGLTAQAYTITGSDANGCTISTVITLTDPGQLTWNNPTFTNISCFGGNNGTINAPLSGGTGVITYSLTPGALTNTSGFFGALTAQCYTVTGTDVNGCSLTTVICLSEPPVLTLGVPATVNILCNGASTGSISITANGGTPNYTFSLNPAQGTQVTPGNFINLPAGTYAITVTDNNGCTSVTTGIQLSEPPAITFNTVNVQDVACYGDATGTITVVAQGGVGGFTYSLNPSGAQPTPGFFNNLYAGLYTAIATDANGCTLATSIEVKQNPELLITSLTLTEPICFGESNGAISAVATGGVAPIQYSLNNSPFQNNGNFVNIPAGSYIITLRDVLGCMKDSLIELTQPSEVGATLDLTGANCVDSKDGRAIVTAFGGRGGYKYYVTPGLYINKSGVFTGLENGTYTLRVADTAGCEYSTTFVINPPANALSNYMTKLDLACHGKGNEGTATANVSGGTPPYNYLWNTSPAQTTPTASTLYFGLYKVEITDANGCRIKDSVYIEEGPCCDIAFIPSAFSPNGDNNNDEFRVLTTAGVELIQLEVRNRWGQRVWSTSDYRKGWDGLFEGKAADVDTYQYLLRYRCTRDGEIYLKKGDVLLVR